MTVLFGGSRPSVYGLPVVAVGQLLFVLAFGAGAFHYLGRTQHWRALGFLIASGVWLLTVGGTALERLFGGDYVNGLLALLVFGIGFVLASIAAEVDHVPFPTEKRPTGSLPRWLAKRLR